MGDHGDGVKCGQDSNLSQCECDEMCTRSETMRARSVELFVGVHVVKRHAIVDVLCGPVVADESLSSPKVRSLGS